MTLAWGQIGLVGAFGGVLGAKRTYALSEHWKNLFSRNDPLVSSSILIVNLHDLNRSGTGDHGFIESLELAL